MKFYIACIEVAQRIDQEMTRENKELFMETDVTELWKYHFTLGTWIRNQYLDEKNYLYKAFLIVGYTTKDAMSSYLLEFTQQYLLLKRANML